MTKAEFVRNVAQRSGLSQTDARRAVDAFLSTIEDTLRHGDKVSFTGFRKFHVATGGAREGRNPRTGETMTLAVPKFTASPALRSLPGKGTEDF